MDTQTIYEIFRACRLCGAGGGYKMPIIQSVLPVGLGGSDVDVLQHKIRECVQLEVTPDDKMPPLICELCVDKVNDFYEFLDMVRSINRRTRQRLGLPAQPIATVQGGSDGDCILGVTEPVYVDDDDDEVPLSSTSKKRPGPASKRSIQNELQNLLKDNSLTITKTSRRGRSPVTVTTSHSQDTKKSPAASRALKRTNDTPEWFPEPEDDSFLAPLAKRAKDVVKTTTSDSGKKVRLIIKQPIEPGPFPKPKPSKPGPKSSKQEPKSTMPEIGSKLKIQFESPKTKKDLKKEKEAKKRDVEVPAPKSKGSKGSKDPMCNICGDVFKNLAGVHNHQRIHVVTFTNPKQACSACGEWFDTADEAQNHHKWHKTNNVAYRCRRCHGAFKRNLAFIQHMENNCVPWPEVKDVKCPSCWQMFPTQYLVNTHSCRGEDGRPGGQCKTCKRTYSVYKTLKKHEASCGGGARGTGTGGAAKKKREEVNLASVKKKKDDAGAVRIPPSVRKRLRKMQVRMVRCDSLLKKYKQKVNVKNVPHDFGLVKTCTYPYKKQPLAAKVKQERWSFDGMVRLGHNIQNELYKEEDYVHWDSDYSSDDDEFDNDKPKFKKVDNLSTLALKTLFSKRCLGKVPRKLRKIKPDKNFDSLFNNDEDFSLNINSIIGSLDDDDKDKDDSDKFNINSIIGSLGDDKSENGGSDKIKMLSDKIDKALNYGSDSLSDNTGPSNDDFDSLFNNKIDNGKSQVDNGKSHTEKGDASEKAIDNDKNDNKTDASIGETVNKSDITTNNVETSNLAGFDIDIDINGETKTVNGDKDDMISGKIDSLDTSVKSDGKPYLDRISDEEFNFDA